MPSFFFLLPILLPLVASTSKMLFNPDKAKDFWFYESASYCSQAQISIWNTSIVSEAYPNLIDIEAINNAETETQFYTAYDTDRNLGFIAFRGTILSLENWVHNLNAFRTNVEQYCQGCEVHSGFLNQYLPIKDKIRTALLNLKNKHPNAEIAILGHSLGAALATLAFLDLYDEVKPDYFYTYGLPRVGNQAFVDFVDQNFQDILKVRITHYKDIVPRVPGTSLGYRHFKTEVFYYEENSMKFRICKENEDVSCIEQFLLINFSIEDHRKLFGLNMHEFKVNCQ